MKENGNEESHMGMVRLIIEMETVLMKESLIKGLRKVKLKEIYLL